MADVSESPDSGEVIAVEVAYALPDRQTLLRLKLPQGVTAIQAIEQSGMLDMHPEIDLASSKIGIFAKPVTLDRVLREGDRVEIYRPLIADPKVVRRQRAAEGKKMKKGSR